MNKYVIRHTYTRQTRTASAPGLFSLLLPRYMEETVKAPKDLDLAWRSIELYGKFTYLVRS